MKTNSKPAIYFAYPIHDYGKERVTKAFAYLKKRFPEYRVFDAFFTKNGVQRDIEEVRDDILYGEMLILLENGQMLTKDVYELASAGKSEGIDLCCIREIEGSYVLVEVNFLNEVFLSENEFALVCPCWPDRLSEMQSKQN